MRLVVDHNGPMLLILTLIVQELNNLNGLYDEKQSRRKFG